MRECFTNKGNIYESFIKFYDIFSINLLDFESMLHPKEKKLLMQKNNNNLLLRSKRSIFCAKSALKEFLGISNYELRTVALLRGVFGQPVISYERAFFSNPQISLSYTNSTVGVLLYDSLHPMGLDIEEITLADSPFLADFLTDYELNLIFSNRGILTKEMFFSAKESLSKILKTGLTSPLTMYEITEFICTETKVKLFYKNFTQYCTEVGISNEEFQCVTLPINSNRVYKEFVK